MISNLRGHQNPVVSLNGKQYRKHVLLADVNIPYKLAIDRGRNNLFFCINADEFSNQSFLSVLLNLDTGFSSIIPGIRNGFASTVDHASGDVYLGGSDGIFKFNYDTQDVEKPALINGVDIFDMYFDKNLYFVDTGSQNLYVYKNNKKCIVPEVKGCLIHHFVIGSNGDLIFASPSGMYVLAKGAREPVLYDDSYLNIRGATVDVNGAPHFIAHDGIYAPDHDNHLTQILPIENGHGLAFDKDNNIIYSNERSVTRLKLCEVN